MIWAIYLLIALITVLFLVPAFLGGPRSEFDSDAVKSTDAEADQEARDYFTQIEAVQQDETLSEAQRDAATLGLQRQLLERQARRREATNTGSGSPRLGLLMVALILAGGLGVYRYVGAPALTKPGALQMAALPSGPVNIPAQVPSGSPEAEMTRLVEQLAQRLATDRAEDAQGWLIYARSLMGLRRYEEALRAYDQVVALTQDDAAAIEERDRARAFIAERPVGEAPADGAEQGAMRGPTAADIEAAQSLSDEDRAAMIQGMVDSLRARLDDNPRDAAGWVRLLRARAVLGQEEAAANDIERLRAAFSDEPERVEAILVETGWSDE